MKQDKKAYILEIHPVAMERCFLVADILESIGQPFTEYGLVGLASEKDPFYVIATPLLHGQIVSSASVVQPARQLFRLREEIQMLSNSMKTTLIASTFVHRHPFGVTMSGIDEDFLLSTFVSHAFSAYTVEYSKIRQTDHFICGCNENRKLYKNNCRDGQVEYCVCFSIIVNKKREFSITAAVKKLCTDCGQESTHFAPAALSLRPDRQLTAQEHNKLVRLLEIEIESKLHFEEDKVYTIEE